MLRGPESDVAVLLATFGLTVLVDLTVAVIVGMVLILRMRHVPAIDATGMNALMDLVAHIDAALARARAILAARAAAGGERIARGGAPGGLRGLYRAMLRRLAGYPDRPP